MVQDFLKNVMLVLASCISFSGLYAIDQQRAELSLRSYKNRIWDYAPSVVAVTALAVNHLCHEENVTEFTAAAVSTALTVQMGVVARRYIDNRFASQIMANPGNRAQLVQERRKFLEQSSYALPLLAMAPAFSSILLNQERFTMATLGKCVAGGVNLALFLWQGEEDFQIGRAQEYP